MSDASCQQNGAAAAALEALAWLDDDEAAALETLFGAGACDAPAALRCAPRPASPSAHDSEGGSSGRASACTAARAPQPFASPRGHGDAPRSTTRLDGLRFLDADCARGCSKCIAAPPIASESLYQLVGDVGKKNGEKKLRRLLTKTAEWSSAEERVRVAADCDARGAAYVPLALVMRGRENCSALRKGHLLHLARMWGYASHLWRKRSDPSVAPNGGGMQARVAAAAAALRGEATGSAGEQQASPAPTTFVALPLHPLAGAGAELLAVMAGTPPRKGGADRAFDPFHDFGLPVSAPVHRMQHAGAVSVRIRAVLAPMAAESARLFAGSASLAAAAASPPAHRRFLNTTLLSEVLLGIEATRALTSSLATMRRGAFVASARAAAAAPAGCVPGPAWRALLGTQLPCEATVALLTTRFGAAAAFTRARAAAPEQLNAAEAAWLDELYRGQMAGLELMTQVGILQHEIKLAPMDEFMDCAGAVLEMLRVYAADCATNFSSRAAWVQRLAPPSKLVDVSGDDADVEAPSTPLYRFMGRQDTDVMPIRLAIDPPPGTGSGCEDILAERDAARLL